MELGRVYFEKYRILEILGQGGTSNVYLAENIKIGNKWAIKKVRNQINTNLLAEPNILKHLDHRAIPKIIDIEEDEESIYIIEEYVDGINLKAFKLQNEAIEIERIITWIVQLCDVLKYLHSRKPHPIIYRDLKPDNIMLMEEDQIKLVDFGIAREYKEESNNDTVPIGTRGYAAPEQYGIGQSDERTDIFSLGITIYFLLTGLNLSHPPYKIQPFEQLQNGLENRLLKIVLKCCEILPDNRYQSVKALEEAFSELRKSGVSISQHNRNNITKPGLISYDLEGEEILETNKEKSNKESVTSKKMPILKKRQGESSIRARSTQTSYKKNKTNNRSDNGFHVKQTVTIGLLGVTAGIGVTHTSIMLAGYLSKMGSVAIIELNRSKHFLEIGLIAEENKVLQDKCFTYNKIRYFWDIDYSNFLTQHRDKFDFIILDLGNYTTLRGIEEFLRTDIRLVIAHGMDWKVRELISFYELTKDYDPNNYWIYLLPLMDQKTLRGIKSLIKKQAYPVPYNMNPFVVNTETKNIFESILKR